MLQTCKMMATYLQNVFWLEKSWRWKKVEAFVIEVGVEERKKREWSRIENKC